MRAGRDVVGRRAAQREVEQHELQLAGAVLGDADVLGLDVAMGHTFGFEVVHRFDQLFAEALQHVERQAALFLSFSAIVAAPALLSSSACGRRP